MAADIRHIAADGITQQAQQVWGPFISTTSEVTATKTKFGIENIGTRTLGASPFASISFEIQQVGTNDGYTFYYTAEDTATLSKPWGTGSAGAPITAVSAGGGVWGATGTYGYRVSATNATGETIASVEATAIVSATTQRVTITWVQTPGATGYKVFRTATPGTYGATTLRTTIVSGATISFIDDGSATVAGTPASDNTTGGAGPAYGTPPADGSFDQTDKVIAVDPDGLAVGQEWYYWGWIRVPAATSEVGNTRTLKLTPVETT